MVQTYVDSLIIFNVTKLEGKISKFIISPQSKGKACEVIERQETFLFHHLDHCRKKEITDSEKQTWNIKPAAKMACAGIIKLRLKACKACILKDLIL